MSHTKEITEILRIEQELHKLQVLTGPDAERMRKKLFQRAEFYSNKFKKRFK